ncbi:hypothetical protein [Bowmanella sp. JS7-9]|uniref:Uncharacterized protein n=1 Tax=Pseudobowmanella zhangzhouensis TaxID=1537679 RepID=A0ABW1XJX7_9ALTE|nr:hypothetical protein [Bowmanella sp. JS7-9]TBX21284.1 hypothetical protein TK45_12005 [Bowmanella sp. JS7-9]
MFEVILFMLLVAVFSLGLGSIVYGMFFSDAQGEDVLVKRIEFGYLGVAGLVASIVLLYAM